MIEGSSQGITLKNILITGGARSGKSQYAQELATNSGGAVLFVATAIAGDQEMRQRIEQHRRSRPASWQTLEVSTHVGDAISRNIGPAQVVIVDCITLLINYIFSKYGDTTGEGIDAHLVENEVVAEVGELVECCHRVAAGFIIVTNEVGTGLVPADRISRLYRDLLGKANQLLAQQLDEVLLMVAGLPVLIKPAPR